MPSRELLDMVLRSLDDDKALDPVSIDLAGKTTFADWMVVATGTSQRHIASCAEKLIERLKALGLDASVEGLGNSDWVLIDAGDVIVHVFRPEVRHFYNLEKMWGGDRPAERAAS